MGLLCIHSSLIESDPQLIESAFYWLKQECKAEIKEIELPFGYDKRRSWIIEGEGIPKGETQFDLICRTIVPGVIAFNIG